MSKILQPQWFYRRVVEELSPGRWLVSKVESIEDGILVGRDGEKVKLCPPLLLIGIGKSTPQMALAIKKAAPGAFKRIIVVSPLCPENGIRGIECVHAPHPLPDERSVSAAGKVVESLESHGGDVLFLISGGGSSALELPREGVSIATVRRITESLLRAGADIKEMNSLRRALSEVKGGGLLKWVKGRWASLIASDLYDDSLLDIASGPTVHVEEGPERALEVLKKYRLDKEFPEMAGVIKGALPTPPPDAIERGRNYLALSMREGAWTAGRILEGVGIKVCVDGEPRRGDVEEEVKRIIGKGRGMEGNEVAFVSWGEMSVRVVGDGMGGRCSEAVLRALRYLEEDEAFIAIATDGRDGNSPSAGGWVRGEDVKLIGEELNRYLENSDSYSALKRMGRVLLPEEGGTNVADLYIYLRGVRLQD